MSTESVAAASSRPDEGAEIYGSIDIVVSPHTPLEVDEGQIGVDTHFMDKVRMPEEIRRGVPMEEYVAIMDRAGIERSLLISVHAGDLRVKYSYRIPHERVSEYCARFPGRFHGVAGIDPSQGMRGLREFEGAIRDYGMVGAHLYPHWFEWPPDHAKYYPFYAKCCELDVPIMMQVGHCLDYQRDRVLPSVGRPITLDRVAIDFPELKLIGIHVGWPWTEEMIAMCWKHNNVYMAGDAYAPKHWAAEFVNYANSWGQDKCLFGTDWPVVGPERARREVEELGLKPQAKRKLLRDNAIKLFNIPEAVGRSEDASGTSMTVTSQQAGRAHPPTARDK